jgi:hypothetical protein
MRPRVVARAGPQKITINATIIRTAANSTGYLAIQKELQHVTRIADDNEEQMSLRSE